MAEWIILLAILAFLAAIIIPGARRTPAHAKAAAELRKMRASEPASATASGEWASDGDSSNSDIVLLTYRQ